MTRAAQLQGGWRPSARAATCWSFARLRAAASSSSRTWRRIPRAGRACFVIAFVNVAVWTVLIPPFEVPDEITHFAYAQYLAETARLPRQTGTEFFSAQENAALFGINYGSILGAPLERGPYSALEQQQLRAVLAAPNDQDAVGGGAATNTTNQPPLYYALEVVPYWLSPSNNILTRLEFMRLLSALLCAGTVLAVFYFLRELVPRTPWAWTVGALMVAFQPTFAFIGAGVNSDSLLFLASALTFLGLARAWRRGLTMRRAAFIGGALAVGALAKLTFLALVPGAGLGLLLLAWRDHRNGWPGALRKLGVGAAVAVAPVGLYLLLNATVWGRGATGGGLAGVTSGPQAGSQAITWHQVVDYVWQLYLPKLPFMQHTYFFGYYPLWNVWLDGSIGHFGLLDYAFPRWVYLDFRWLVFALAGLGAVGLYRVRHAVRPLLGLLASYAAMAAGLLVVVGYLSARAALTGQPFFPQARYLFPLLVLYALAIILATKALPHRWGRVLGALLVVLALAHNLFAETLTISRYYG